MSLLIKALDSAEKTKQAEKNKKLESQRKAEPALELTPLDAVQPEVVENADVSAKEPEIGTDDKLELTPLSTQKLANSLTLEEEAGLSPSPMAVKKYPKAKSENAKPSVAITDNPREPVTESEQVAATTPFIAASAPVRSTSNEPNQKAAAKVFVANQAVTSLSSKYALLILGIAGALIIWLGLQGYTYLKPLLAPEVVAIQPVSNQSVEINPAPLQSLTDTTIPTENPAVAVAVPNLPSEENMDLAEANDVLQPTGSATKSASNPATTLTKNETLVAKADPVQSFDKADIVDNAITERSPLKVTSKTPPPAIDPALTSAYQAFTRGEDSAAQQLYRQVLQKDIRNIDALLGMAAIAQRQGRNADAMGWFQKVLEVEPRNTIAQSAMIDSQLQIDTVGAESRIKNMLALQPESANLHAALGNLYAEQNQWGQAQEAYFNASRFAPANADYAFNLAISLDQLGKTDLALRQYRRALELVNQGGTTSPDRAQLEARIQALQ